MFPLSFDPFADSAPLPPSQRRPPPSTPISQILPAEFPAKFPYSKKDFERYDETRDGFFYSMPRFVTHIDDAAISALTAFYGAEFDRYTNDGDRAINVLDICSSWVSHLPERKYGSVVGVGMNKEELERNPVRRSRVIFWTNTF